MVLAEKHNNSLKNGQRSRGPSPNSNGGASPASPIEEDGEKIRVGRDYQAICPELLTKGDTKPDPKELSERALLVWSPSNHISDQQLDEYIQIAKEKYGYNGEQALGMLFWHKHDLEKAVVDLANFTPFPDEWTAEDKVLFEQAFTFHGKTFHRIRQMLPDKSMGSLVKYYYSWKKTRTRTSLMDRQARKVNVKEEPSEQGSEQGSNSDSENDDSKTAKENGDGKEVVEAKDGKNYCHNCGIPCSQTKTTPKGPLCNTCFLHWRKTGNMRPTIGPMRGRDRHSYNWLKKKWRPPRGMHIDHEDLVALSSDSSSALFVSLDREIASLKRQVQNNKQAVSNLKKKNTENVEELRPGEPVGKVNARWSNEEISMAVQGVRTYGKNYKAIADIVGSKTEQHIKNFFVTHRKRCNLDAILKEFEAENGMDAIKKEIKMDVDESPSEQPVGTPPTSAK